MNVETHLYVTLDEDGEIQTAYHTMEEADAAIESNGYYHEGEVDLVMDVPLMKPSD